MRELSIPHSTKDACKTKWWNKRIVIIHYSKTIDHQYSYCIVYEVWLPCVGCCAYHSKPKESECCKIEVAALQQNADSSIVQAMDVPVSQIRPEVDAINE